MDLLRWIILAFVGVIGVCAIIETRRRQSQANKRVQPERFGGRAATTPTPLASEVDPTQTGRIRVKEMLAKTGGLSPQDKSLNANSEEDEEPLPDPFADEKKKT